MKASPGAVPETDDTIYMVVQWKDELEPGSPWWKRWYYYLIHRPINEFSLKVVKIPPHTETVINGRKVSFSRFDVQGFFSSADAADLACLGERWSYKDYLFGRLMPPESGQYGSGPVFPRAKNPTKRSKPILEMVITSRKKQEQERQRLQEVMDQLHQVLDQ